MIRDICPVSSLRAFTLVLLILLTALLSTGCAKFNTVLGSDRANDKDTGSDNLFVPGDGNDTREGENGNSLNDDIVVPPAGGDEELSGDSGGGRRS